MLDITPDMLSTLQRLVEARFYARCRALSIEPDDLVQDVLLTAISRDDAAQKSAYDPARGAWCTWCFACIRSLLSHRQNKHDSRKKHEESYLDAAYHVHGANRIDYRR